MQKPDKNPLVTITENGNEVKMEFSKDLPVDVIKEQVESCQTGTCDCCTPAFKERVEGFKMAAEDGRISVTISGQITGDEVWENMLSCTPKLSKVRGE